MYIIVKKLTSLDRMAVFTVLCAAFYGFQVDFRGLSGALEKAGIERQIYCQLK